MGDPDLSPDEEIFKNGARIYSAQGMIRLRVPREPDKCDDLDCEDCGRYKVVHYECVLCGFHFSVAGQYIWSWQGHGHWHICTDEKYFEKIIADHLLANPGHCFAPRPEQE